MVQLGSTCVSMIMLQQTRLMFIVVCVQCVYMCLSAVYFGYTHSQSQAVILQVLGVGGGVVGERGVGDELRPTTRPSILLLTSNSIKAII